VRHFDIVSNPKFVANPISMGVDRLGTHMEQSRQIFGGVSLDQQSENLQFAIAQNNQRVAAGT
jgi:hypothetical protein